MHERCLHESDWAEGGDPTAVEHRLLQTEAAWQKLSPSIAEWSQLQRFVLRFYGGNWSEPLDVLATLGRAFPYRSVEHMFWAYAFLIKAYRGEPDAVPLLQAHRERLPGPGVRATWGTWWSLKTIIEGLVVLNERAWAASLYPAGVTALSLGHSIELAGVCETSTALAAACGAQWDLAERHFQSALRTARTAPHLLGEGDTLRWYAWMCLERSAAGDTEKALALLDDAQRVYERIGMPKHIEMVHALRARAEQHR